MALRALAVLATVLLVACSAAAPEPMPAEAVRFGGVSIECGGDRGLSEHECQAWGEELLSSGPIETTALVMTYRTGNSRCAADYFAAHGQMLMTAAARCPAP